jgi:hypothetical protein
MNWSVITFGGLETLKTDVLSGFMTMNLYGVLKRSNADG